MLEEPVALTYDQTPETLLELVGRHLLVGHGGVGGRSEPLRARGVLGGARDIAEQLRRVGCVPHERELLVFDVGESATIALSRQDFVRAIVFRDEEDEPSTLFLAIELRGARSFASPTR
jgi:hypothetical protein